MGLASAWTLERIALALLLVVVWAKGTLWSTAVPLWRGIDEAVHFATVQFIAEHGRLPGPDDVYRSDEIIRSGELADVARLPFRPTQRQTFGTGHIGPREAEIRGLDPALRTSYETRAYSSAAHAPPLYHALGALVYHLVRRGDVLTRAFAVRQFSVLLGVLTTWLVYLTVRELFPPGDAPAQDVPGSLMRLAVPLLVGFQPMFTYLTATVNTDAPLFVVFALLTWLLVRAIKRGLSYGLAAAIGATIGLGMLVKPLVATAMPPLAFVLLLEFLRRRKGSQGAPTFKWAALTLGLLAASALLVSAPSMARNMSLSGNPFYIVDPNIAENTPDPELQSYPLGRYLANHSISLTEGLLVSYWADFGTLDTPLAPMYYLVIRWVVIAAITGVGLYMWREGRPRWRELSLLILFVLFHVVMLDAYDYYFWRSNGVGAVGQGKYYLYPAAAQFTLLSLGLVSLLPRRARAIALGALCLGMIWLHYVSLLGYLLPRYYV